MSTNEEREPHIETSWVDPLETWEIQCYCEMGKDHTLFEYNAWKSQRKGEVNSE